MTQPGAPGATCQSCGAPDKGDRVFCYYCRAAYSQHILASAIPCPHCRLQNRWGRQQCLQCNAWLVVSCVFCGATSPCNASACLSCGEGFQGAQQRKAAMLQAQSNREAMQVVSIVGGVAGGFLGGFAGASWDWDD
jgi:hypothetical protein